MKNSIISRHAQIAKVQDGVQYIKVISGNVGVAERSGRK